MLRQPEYHDFISIGVKTMATSRTSLRSGFLALTGGLLVLHGTAHAAPHISVADISVTESPGAVARFTVSIDEAPEPRKPLSVRIETRDGSARAGSDFESTQTTLTFRNGEGLTQSFSVPIVNDATPEETEAFSVALRRPRNGEIGDGTGVATILDDDATPNQPPECRIDTPARSVALRPGGSTSFSATVTDPDGDALNISWHFPGGTPGASAAEDPGNVRFDTPGTYTVTLDAGDGRGGSCVQQTRSVTVSEAPAVSINSTSAAGLDPAGIPPVPERPKILGGNYSVLAVNDLGMHCVDLDGRIANILPPFQVLLTQVVEKGVEPEVNPAGLELYYSAASNPNDPILSSPDPFNGIADDGTLYKLNFWDAALGSYDAFYPPIATPLATGPFPVTEDVGLPVPNAEDLYIGPDGIVDGTATGSSDGYLSAVQHAMPGEAGPLLANDPQPVLEYYENKPFFVNFPIGYVADEVNWFEAAGIPMAPFDDVGRQNPFPLVRVEARIDGVAVATSDTVLPVSSETSCSNCHSSPVDVPGARSTAPTQVLADAGLTVATSSDDPALGSVPPAVSIEYAADINILRLHDLKHGANYVDTANHPIPCAISPTQPDGNDSCLIFLPDQPRTRAGQARGLPELSLHAGARSRAGRPNGRAAGQSGQRTQPARAREQFARDAQPSRRFRGAVPADSATRSGSRDRRHHQPGRAHRGTGKQLLSVPPRKGHQVPARRDVQRRRALQRLSRQHAAGRRRLLRRRFLGQRWRLPAGARQLLRPVELTAPGTVGQRAGMRLLPYR